MNETPENIKKDTASQIGCKLSKISDYALKSDYDVTLQLMPNEAASTPTCSHHFKGSMKHNLICMLALGGIIAGAMAMGAALIHACCSMKHCCR